MKQFDEILNECVDTCSAKYPQDNCLSYALKTEYLELLLSSGCKVTILVPLPPRVRNRFLFSPTEEGNALLVPATNPERIFIEFHNKINESRMHRPDVISTSAIIHPRAVIGNDGLKYCKGDSGDLIKMKHVGGIVIGDHVEVGPCATIARATLDYTVIKHHAKIDAGVHIGHNSEIGSNTMIVQGAAIGGSAKIGSNCFIGLNAAIRNGVKICNDVFIGMGSVVAKDINRPGVYYGSPAVWAKDWDGKW